MVLVNLLLWFLVGVGVILLVAWLGFLVPARAVPPQAAEGLWEQRPLPDGLPSPLRGLWGDPAPAVSSVAAWGVGRVVVGQFGPLGKLWAPMRWWLYLIPGEGFTYKSQVTWYRQVFISSEDSLYQGKGMFKAGARIRDGVNMDRSETTLFWLLSIFTAPTALAWLPNLDWETLDDHHVRLKVMAAEGASFSFDLHFDPQSAALIHVETLRTAMVDGRDTPYRAVFDRQQEFVPGLTLPGRMFTAWEDTPAMQLELRGVRYNADVRDWMEEGL